MRIYVASSWRNDYQPDVIRGLRELGHEVYDFRHPSPGDNGFHWSEIDPQWKRWSVAQYVAALEHSVAEDGYAKDFSAMQWAEGCVLVNPCGRSAHLESGWFVGQGKPLWILGAEEPELMYKMANGVFAQLATLLLAVQDFEDALQSALEDV